MTFLISNDDGVHAPGLLALYRALSEVGEVIVVAPNTEQSGYASALSISQPLYAQTLDSGFVAVNGSPADCVYLALHELYADSTFDAVITGINSGANLGQDVMFSGTFGAALTAQLFGVPAIATSLVGGVTVCNGQDKAGQYAYDRAAQEIKALLTDTAMLATIKDLPYHVLNVNIPAVSSCDEIQGRKITRLGHSRIKRPVHHITDPRGRDAYWLSLRKDQRAPTASLSLDESRHPEVLQTIDTDNQAVAAGYVSVSPVRLHHTPAAALDTFSSLAM